MSRLDLIATSAFGLESAVSHELERLGYADRHVENGRVTFRGDLRAIARTNLWLRVADRVLLRLGEFPAPDFDALYDGVRALPWGEWLPADARAWVNGNCVRSALSSEPAVQRVANKAIIDALAAHYRRTDFPETGVTYRVLVSITSDVATLTLDTTGDGLHKRGYRPAAAPAPLKETLAAGLLSLARWTPERPFADPLCGSGTLPIEAALIALDRAPGLARTFDAEAWAAVPAGVFESEREAARERARAASRSGLVILGSDLAEEAIARARKNAVAAGVSEVVRFERRAVRDFAPKEAYGTIVTNPPYGERLGSEREVLALTRDMAHAFRERAATWGVHVLTGWPGFEATYGPAPKKRKLYNGKLRVDLFSYPGPRRPRPEASEAAKS